jgi:hypothetical protein
LVLVFPNNKKLIFHFSFSPIPISNHPTQYATEKITKQKKGMGKRMWEERGQEELEKENYMETT